jgi:Pirin-related protein
MKKITGVYTAPAPHWVGNGFPVRSLFSYQSHGEQLSPFLLLDYAGPFTFPAGGEKRGVGEHPHRGFETVTLVYDGEVEHRDSTGKGGVIGPGDVQWMTAGAGILHEEFHSQAFSQTGGELKMIQLWVNLPAKDKMATPGYQSIRAEDIPHIALPDGSGNLRVIAGRYQDVNGPAHTFSPLNVWDMQLKQGRDVEFTQPNGWTHRTGGAERRSRHKRWRTTPTKVSWWYSASKVKHSTFCRKRIPAYSCWRVNP